MRRRGGAVRLLVHNAGVVEPLKTVARVDERELLAYGFVCAPFMPRAVPIDVVFGGALDVARFVDGDGGAPSAAQVEALREAYCEAVAALFESHKHQFGYGHKRVEWIDHRSVDAK